MDSMSRLLVGSSRNSTCGIPANNHDRRAIQRSITKTSKRVGTARNGIRTPGSDCRQTLTDAAPVRSYLPPYKRFYARGGERGRDILQIHKDPSGIGTEGTQYKLRLVRIFLTPHSQRNTSHLIRTSCSKQRPLHFLTVKTQAL